MILKKAIVGVGILAAASLAGTTLEDFEDNQVNAVPGVAADDLGYWYGWGDNGGTFSPDSATIAGQSGGSMTISLTKGADPTSGNLYPSAGIGVNFKDPKGSVNVQSGGGFIVTFSGLTAPTGTDKGLYLVLDDGGEDGKEWMCKLETSPQTCAWSNFSQLSWLDSTNGLETAIPYADLKGIQFAIKTSEAASAGVTISNIEWINTLSGTSSSSSTTPSSSSSIPVGTSLTLEDFEDNQANAVPGVAADDLGYWYGWGDNGGTFSPDSATIAGQSGGSMAITLTKGVDPTSGNSYPSAGIGLNFKDPKGSVNVQSGGGFIVTFSGLTAPTGTDKGLYLVLDDGGEDGKEWMCKLETSPQTCAWSNFSQLSWLDSTNGLETAIPYADLKGIQFAIKTSEAGSASVTISNIDWISGNTGTSSSSTTPSSSSTTPSSSSSAPVGSGSLMEDFEDNQVNGVPGVAAADLGYWYGWGDNGGTFSPDSATIAGQTGGSMAITLTKGADPTSGNAYPSAGIGVNFKDPKGSVNIESTGGLVITYSGLSAPSGTDAGLYVVLDDGDEDGKEWMCKLTGTSPQTCAWSDFGQMSWVSDAESSIPFASLKGIQFAIKTSDAGTASVTLSQIDWIGGSTTPSSSSTTPSSSSTTPSSSSTTPSSSSSDPGTSSSSEPACNTDITDGMGDYDCDGIPNWQDDVNKDGIVEFMGDDDKDGIINSEDPDWIYFTGVQGINPVARTFSVRGDQLLLNSNGQFVQVSLYSISGTLVRNLYEGQLNGATSLNWNQGLNRGVYLIRVQAGSNISVKKLSVH